MADITCCDLVGNFPINSQTGIISINSRSSTKVTLLSDGSNLNTVVTSPSAGTLTITAYASFDRYHGCPGRIGVSVPWVEKNDCDKYTYIFGGYGQSYISGEDNGGGFAEFPSNISGITNPVNEYNTLQASASSGPAARYEDSIQRDGYGLIYYGLPWGITGINTTKEADCVFNLTDFGVTKNEGGQLIEYYGDCLLQSLSLDLNPGEIPIVTLEFKYQVGADGALNEHILSSSNTDNSGTTSSTSRSISTRIN